MNTPNAQSSNNEDFEPWLYQGAPALVAHRGYASQYPENTEIAVREAVKSGAKCVEFDIQLSRDLVPFLMHDISLQRTGGVEACVSDLFFSDIAENSVGEPTRFGSRYMDEKPISLSALCGYLNERPNVHSFIEIKQESIDRFGLETVVTQTLDAIRSLQSPHTLISFNQDVVSFTRSCSDVSAGWVIPNWTRDNLDWVEQMLPDCVFCNYKKVPPDAQLESYTSPWVLYEIATAKDATFARNVGASLIETMDVEPMLSILAGAGAGAGDIND